MADESGDKTELPSDHRRTEVRERGNVARSADLITATSVLAAAGVLYFCGAAFAGSLLDVMRTSLTDQAWDHAEARQVTEHMARLMRTVAAGVLPVWGVLWVASFAVTAAQVGFVMTPQVLQPNFSRINPVEGFKRVFSMHSVVRLGNSVLKLVVLLAVVILFIMSRLPEFLATSGMPLPQMVRLLGAHLVDLAFQLALALMTLGVLDYLFQRWKFDQDIRMSKQEVREELRHMEGDPQIRQRRKEAHRKLTNARQIQAVKTADVVVTNPTEYAVAIKYDAARMAAPLVIAKGVDEMALRIRQVAAEHRIPIVEKKPLARALYRDVRVGQPVPVELYEAVAEILAYVYRIGGKLKRR